MVKYCPRCGTQVPDDARFCPKCGFDFSTLQQPSQQPTQSPMQQSPQQPTQPQIHPLIDTATRVSRYIPTLTRYGKLLVILAIIFEGLTTILFTADALTSSAKYSGSATTIAIDSLLMISAIFYLIAPIFSFPVKGLEVKKLTIILGIFAFLLLAISYILIAKETSSSSIVVRGLTIYGVPLCDNITAGIIILIGVIFIILSIFMNLGQLVNSIIQVVGIILIYAYTYYNNFNFESFLWGVAVSIVIIFNLIPYFYKGEYAKMIVSIGYSIGILIFTIGTLITGISQVSAGAPPSYSSALLHAMYGTYLTAGVLGILAGALGILDSIFMLIYAITMKSSPPM
ncbi:MAG: zinc ribbon domain-containing protein [Acidianus infernus]|nr:zinc ribbon domain-containing protein [Acidianus infernus]